jgi:acetylornithine aminotransferase
VAADVAARCRAQRVIVNAVAPDVLRIAPPLTITADEVTEALAVLVLAIEAAVHDAAAGTEPA